MVRGGPGDRPGRIGAGADPIAEPGPIGAGRLAIIQQDPFRASAARSAAARRIPRRRELGTRVGQRANRPETAPVGVDCEPFRRALEPAEDARSGFSREHFEKNGEKVSAAAIWIYGGFSGQSSAGMNRFLQT